MNIEIILTGISSVEHGYHLIPVIVVHSTQHYVSLYADDVLVYMGISIILFLLNLFSYLFICGPELK